ncbi:hypothetical protein GCM10010441_11630 [Kitasatospora paracochleata]|uniref:Uncharacterized protein n=1 Tax=Kitasatospora paracochleata TaxID=58354 RepID=A0ABT1JA15_9ACTN|nr:hypothetical protein [Kitasatospora paracochleata]MCP2314303.1 hypothetical protein [Kitasatospora paracochleata]
MKYATWIKAAAAATITVTTLLGFSATTASAVSRPAAPAGIVHPADLCWHKECWIPD